MTFVAQPYERFVDDLLIALTGGTIREEHEFTGVDRAYALGAPDVVVDSLRVFGQRDGTFALFEQGIDFRYDAEEDAVAWLADGRPPEDRTFFYVSYFTGEDGGGRLTDRNPGSVTTTLAEAFARQYAVLHKQMRLIYESAFVDLATGTALDHVAALLDVTRRDAQFATGEVLFKRSTPAPGDIAVAVGTLVSTAEGQAFETTAPRTLRRDQLSVVVPVRAQEHGPAGAVAPGAIALVNRPIFGIEGVANERATFFAADRETDEELRRRIRGRLHRAGRSTLEAIKTNLIDTVGELTEANVQVAEAPEAPGTVDVRLGVAGGFDDDLVRRVDEAILQARPAGVRVRHNLSAAPMPEAPPAADVGRQQAVAALAAFGAPEPAASPPGDESVLPLRVEVLLRLGDPSLTAAEREAVEETVRTAVVAHVEALPMGAALVHAKLLGRVVASDDVADATLLVVPLADGEAQPAYRTNLVAEGRKLTVTPADVAVYPMDQHVRLDVRVQLEERIGASGEQSQVTLALEEAVKAAIGRVTAVARTVTRDAVREAVAEAVAAGTPDLLLAATAPVVLNASYDETGRLLNDVAELVLDEHEVAVLRTLTLERLGALDG